MKTFHARYFWFLGLLLVGCRPAPPATVSVVPTPAPVVAQPTPAMVIATLAPPTPTPAQTPTPPRVIVPIADAQSQPTSPSVASGGFESASFQSLRQNYANAIRSATTIAELERIETELWHLDIKIGEALEGANARADSPAIIELQNQRVSLSLLRGAAKERIKGGTFNELAAQNSLEAEQQIADQGGGPIVTQEVIESHGRRERPRLQRR